MKLLLLALMLMFPQAQTETIQVKVMKMERTKRPEEQALWYKITIVVRSQRNHLYRASTNCVDTNPDSDIYCGKVQVPRVGETYTVKLYNQVGMAFDKTVYEIESEEVMN